MGNGTPPPAQWTCRRRRRDRADIEGSAGLRHTCVHMQKRVHRQVRVVRHVCSWVSLSDRGLSPRQRSTGDKCLYTCLHTLYRHAYGDWPRQHTYECSRRPWTAGTSAALVQLHKWIDVCIARHVPLSIRKLSPRRLHTVPKTRIYAYMLHTLCTEAYGELPRQHTYECRAVDVGAGLEDTSDRLLRRLVVMVRRVHVGIRVAVRRHVTI